LLCVVTLERVHPATTKQQIAFASFQGAEQVFVITASSICAAGFSNTPACSALLAPLFFRLYKDHCDPVWGRFSNSHSRFFRADRRRLAPKGWRLVLPTLSPRVVTAIPAWTANLARSSRPPEPHKMQLPAHGLQGKWRVCFSFQPTLTDPVWGRFSNPHSRFYRIIGSRYRRGCVRLIPPCQ